MNYFTLKVTQSAGLYMTISSRSIDKSNLNLINHPTPKAYGNSFLKLLVSGHRRYAISIHGNYTFAESLAINGTNETDYHASTVICNRPSINAQKQ